MTLVMPVHAQRNNSGQTDSVVVLMNAQEIRLLEKDGENYRQAIKARFLHNNTYLICDTALWNVDREVINAVGHVQLQQEKTVLTSDELEYVIKIDVARFRGSLVQLQDKDGNILRTKYLDYNTKDSVAYFERGASMKDKAGQVIESDVGTYDSKVGQFTFNRRVNMYSDSVFINTSRLDYYTGTETAYFQGNIDAWKDDDMISSREGYYNKAKEQFFFNGDVHIMSPTQEGWSDSLYFNRLTSDIDMRGNVQLTDTSRHVSGMGDRLIYLDSLSQVTMDGNATVVARTDQGGKVDTVYFGADHLRYWTIPKCDLPEDYVTAANDRLEILSADPVAEYRRKAAEEAAKAAEQAAEELGKTRPGGTAVGERARQADINSLKITEPDEEPDEEPSEDIAAASDSLALVKPVLTAADSLRMLRDSLRNRDTTAIGFMSARGRIRVFKSDMQMACDSLEYTDIDSVARLFKAPKVWNEGNRQYNADSIYVGIKNQKMDRANLMSNAFIVIEEQPGLCYDQIKSTEIAAYFDTSSTLRRFDALGGVNALFYLEENDAFATVNKVEAKMLSALFVDGNIDRLHYFENPKNDAYPVVQLPEEERRMKGFIWSPDERPKSKEDVTGLTLRETERTEYLGHSMPPFYETNKYFPGHIESIRQMLAASDSLRRVRHMEAQLRDQALNDSLVMAEAALPEKALTDSLAPSAEELQLMDSLAVVGDRLLGNTLKDSLTVKPAADTMAVRDTLTTSESVEPELTLAEIRAMRDAEKAKKAEEAAAKKAAAEAKRQARVDAKEARWAELDRRDAEKAAKKEAKALKKKRKRTLAAVIDADKTAARDQAKLMRYVQRYQARKDAADARKARKEESN